MWPDLKSVFVDKTKAQDKIIWIVQVGPKSHYKYSYKKYT